MSHKYSAIKIVQQQGAPPFYVTAGPARQLLEWCDIPRAKADYMAGYQRALNTARSSSLTEYLRISPSNIVPGAVIIAVDSDYVTIADGPQVSEITIRDDERSFEEKLQELFGSFSTRLSNEELESADIEFSADEWEEEEDDEASEPSSYLALLTRELRGAVENWDGLDVERQQAIRSFIDGVSKPGLIIDGQHRVNGAAGVEIDVQLPIVLVPGLQYAEQVFQFYVLNSKARPLRPTELRRIVSTSLTNQEIKDLFQRFQQAGVDPDAARWTHELNTRQDSPFLHRIDFGYGMPGAIIKENVADQLARAFVKMPPRRYKKLLIPLGDSWKTDHGHRLNIFFWFWRAIKDEYEATWAAAEKAADQGALHNLFKKVALVTLQSFVLDRFVTALSYRGESAPPPFSSEEEVRRLVSQTLDHLPGEFFDREWKMTQIDTSEGRKELYEAMEEVHKNQGKLDGRKKPFKA